MKKQFTMIVEKDSESGWFVGEIVELPGCYTQASSLSQLEKNILEAITVYLKTKEIDEPLSEFVGSWKVEATIDEPVKTSQL